VYNVHDHDYDYIIVDAMSKLAVKSSKCSVLTACDGVARSNTETCA